MEIVFQIFVIVGIFLSIVVADESDSAEGRFEKLILFGDSYTDTGNVYKLSGLTWPITPPYYRGRYSNNLNWVDQLMVSDISNYAYGSATTDNRLVQGYAKLGEIRVPGIWQQIELFKNSIESGSSEIDFDETLFIIWGGANDVIFNNALTPPPIVNSLENCMKALIEIGAKHIVVFNQIPNQYVPLAKTLTSTQNLIFLTNIFNNLLAASVARLQQAYTQTSIKIFNVNKVITDIITTDTQFTDVTNPCWIIVNVATVQQICTTPSTFVFLDPVHFTSTVHTIIANAFRNFMLTL